VPFLSAYAFGVIIYFEDYEGRFHLIAIYALGQERAEINIGRFSTSLPALITGPEL
jgi:hypothetical protein